MTHQYEEAKQCLETTIPEALFSYRADLELAQTYADARTAAAKAKTEVSKEAAGYVELMTYAVKRLRETKGAK